MTSSSEPNNLPTYAIDGDPQTYYLQAVDMSLVMYDVEFYIDFGQDQTIRTILLL